MTAKEKFEARAKELGLEEEITKEVAAAVEVNDEIIVLVDEDDCPTRELHFDSFDVLLDSVYRFPRICIDHWLYYDDSEFFQELCQWLYSTGKCPLCPIDVYWLDGVKPKETIEFKDDDEDVESIIRKMSDEELIDFVNKCFTDVPDRNVIYEIGDEDAWDRFESEASGKIKEYFYNSQTTFSFGDIYFFWDNECRQMTSFITAEELLNVLDINVLVDHYKKLNA